MTPVTFSRFRSHCGCDWTQIQCWKLHRFVQSLEWLWTLSRSPMDASGRLMVHDVSEENNATAASLLYIRTDPFSVHLQYNLLDNVCIYGKFSVCLSVFVPVSQLRGRRGGRVHVCQSSFTCIRNRASVSFVGQRESGNWKTYLIMRCFIMPVLLRVRCATRHRRYPFTGRQTVIQRQVRDQALKVGCLHAQCVQKGGLLGLQKRQL